MEITIKIQGLEGLETAVKQLAYAIAENAGTKPAEQLSQVIQNTQIPAAPIQQPLPQMQVQPNYTPVATSQVSQPQTAPAQQIPLQQQYAQAPYVQQQAQQIPVQQQTPVQQQPAQVAVPTTQVQQAYTQEQLAIAMTGLMDAGKRDVIMGILGEFGVQALLELNADHYPALAARLRQEGAAI